MYEYPVVLQPDDNGTVLLTVPDVPETATFGDDEDEALTRAVDAIETALMMYMSDRQRIPVPSKPKRAQKTVKLPALTQAKLSLYSAMLDGGVGKAELSRRLNCHLPQVDRLLDLDHASRLDQLEAALRAVGKKLEVTITAA